jgi:hypothetical protein
VPAYTGEQALSQLSYWHVKWIIPAALVQAALELGGGDPVRGLEVIVERGEPWMRNLARELLLDRRELERILADIRDGLRPDPDLVEKILKTIENRLN